MKVRHLILLLLNASEDCSIVGKTKLQKTIYFTNLLLRKKSIIEDDFSFKAHYYGPYSQKVEEGINELVGAGFMDMTWETFPGLYSSEGYKVKRYNFKLTESGKRFSGQLVEKNPDIHQTVQFLIEKLKELEYPDYSSLSIAAKAYYILNKADQPMTGQQIRDKAIDFDWKFSKEALDNAVKILEKLELIK